MRKASVLTILVCLLVTANMAFADTIRGINIDFVTIGNAGNGTDPATGNVYGAVGYYYRIGKYEVTNAQWNAFKASVGAPTGNNISGLNPYNESASFIGSQQPVGCTSWYEAAQFCNYLTSGDKSKGVYIFSGNNTNPGNFVGINRNTAKATYGMTYFLPTEDEWYKAAYYKPDGSGYSLYANGLNTIPAADNGWNYCGGSYNTPWNVGTGTREQNGTFDMMGNIYEWNETLFYGSDRGLRGGSFWPEEYYYFGDTLISYRQGIGLAYGESERFGFRVASIVPEPATLLLLGIGGLMLRRKK
jgi:sulfatase modifying factor 1